MRGRNALVEFSGPSSAISDQQHWLAGWLAGWLPPEGGLYVAPSSPHTSHHGQHLFQPWEIMKPGGRGF